MSSGYRPPSREPRGRWARHIHAERRQRNWSATVAFEKLLEAGYPLGPKSRSAYLPVDEGKREPTPAEEAALVTIFGYPPEATPEPLEATQTPDALAAAIDRQTAALMGAIAARDTVIQSLLETNAGLLQELRDYRKQTVERQTVEQTLIASLPAALATALAAMRADDPVPDTLEVRPQRA